VTTVTCTATDKVARTNACTFSVTVTAPPRLSVTRFLAFGDSITRGEDGTNALLGMGGGSKVRPAVILPANLAYPGALQAKLANRYTAQVQQLRVENGGSSREAVTSSGTFPRFVAFTSSGAYDAVLLMEGANDLGEHSASEIAAGLARMVDDATSRNMKVFLATIPPENQAGSRGGGAAAVGPLNDRIRALATMKGVTLVEVNGAFGGNLALIGNDGLHPTVDGYDLIAGTFFTSIRQNLELPAATLSLGRLGWQGGRGR
jgi:lysophospholipase L1-like esterase